MIGKKKIFVGLVGIVSVGAVLTILSWANAHTVGGPCSSAAENCEKWSVIMQGPTRPAGQRPDDFPAAIAVSSTTVFAGVHSVNLNVADPYSSTALWTLAAYDLNTGAERWHVFRQSRPYDSLHDVAVSPDGNTVVATGGAFDGFPVGATDSRIVTVAYDSATGIERWATSWDGNAAGVDNSVVVAYSPDGRSVYVGGITTPTPGEIDYITIAYDATNGTQQWVSIYNGLGAGRTNSLDDLVVSPDGKKVYVTGESDGARQYEIDFVTVAYDASSGDQLWVSRSQPTFVDRACCLAVDRDHVYITGDSTAPNGSDYQALTIALRVIDGSVAWQQRLGSSGYNAGHAITAGGGRVVVAAQSPATRVDDGVTVQTAAYDSTTGNQLWVAQVDEPLRSQLANDIALAPDGSHVYVVANSRPNIPDTKLLDQEVIAYNVIDGSAAWSVHMDSGTANSMSGDRVAMAPDGNSVITLGQIQYSANPLGSSDQNIYDSVVVALPAAFSSVPTPTPTATPTPTPTPGPVQLNSVVSRATHGNVGTFDVDLTGGNGIECRMIDSNGDYMLVFIFSNTLMSVSGANVTSGTGTVATSNIDNNDRHNYIVNLSDVTNAQKITVTLTDVTDSAGNFSAAISASMGVLIGDTTNNGAVNSSDISQTQSQSGQPVSPSNFREDVTANGSINSSDIALVQSQSGTGIPSSTPSSSSKSSSSAPTPKRKRQSQRRVLQ